MNRYFLLCSVAACTPSYTPTEQPWPVHAMTAASNHVLMVTERQGSLSAGTVESVGADIGLPDDPETQEPIVLMLPTATAIAVGSSHACIVSSAQVTCWGNNAAGALGAHRACDTDGCLLGPDVMPTLPPIRAIAAGTEFTCATTQEDTVMCWGESSHGELGGSVVSALDEPLPVKVPGDKPLFANRVIIVDSTACAIDREGVAWCWGAGYGATPSQLPLTGVVDISVGSDHGCAIASDGLSCWGNNVNGQIDSSQARDCGDHCTLPATHIALPATRVVVGARHTCALDTTGNVTCWGSNENGQLARSDSFLVGDPGIAFGGAVNLVAGAIHTCALTSDHDAWCWGDF